MERSTWWLIAAALFLVGAFAGLMQVITGTGSWVLVAIPAALMFMAIALYAKTRQRS